MTISKIKRARISLVIGIAAPAFLTASAAWAAAADAADKPASDELGEIIVTSTKRAESLQKVPISIGVIDGSTVQSQHIDNIEDITRTVPGISFTAHEGPGQENISIRGVSSTVGNPTVGIYIDEVPLVTQSGYEGAFTPRLIDLDRVEVLRGPQGTLYGASSEGGTIRFLTAQPKLDSFGGMAQADVAVTRNGSASYDLQGAVNVPLIKDRAAIRVSGEFARIGGYVDNYALDGTLNKKNVNYERYDVVHATGKFLLGDSFTATPSLFYQHTKTGGSGNFYPDEGRYNQSKEVREKDNDRVILPSLTMVKDFGFADLTSVSGYYVRHLDRIADGTVFNSAAVALYYLDPAYPAQQAQNDSILQYVPSPVLFQDRFRTFTQELRLSSKGNGPLHWVGGLFYSDQRWRHYDYETVPGFSQDFANIYGFNINDSVLGSTSNPHLWDNDLIWEVLDHNRVEQYAAFGQVDYDVTRRLHFSAGLRYVYAKEHFSETGGGFFDLGGAGTDGTPYRQHQNFKASTPKFTLSYEASSDTNLYATAAKGFRLGGATTPNTNSACVTGLAQLGYNDAPTTYGSDHLWSYEIGSKSSLFGHSLTVNAGLYYIDWKQIQQTIIIPICGGAFNSNVGDAEAYGGEIEMRWKPRFASGLTLSANFTGEHTEITRTNNASTAAVGQHILNVPRFSGAFSADYAFPVAPSVNGFIHGDYQYTGRSNGSFQVTDTNYRDPGYGVLNMNLGADVGAMRFAVYVKNLLDDKTIIQRPTTNTVVQGYTLRPRTIGITASRSF